MPKAFPYTVLIHTDFFPKILIFLVIYTDFVSDHSGRSAVRSLFFFFFFFCFFPIVPLARGNRACSNFHLFFSKQGYLCHNNLSPSRYCSIQPLLNYIFSIFFFFNRIMRNAIVKMVHPRSRPDE